MPGKFLFLKGKKKYKIEGKKNFSIRWDSTPRTSEGKDLNYFGFTKGY